MVGVVKESQVPAHKFPLSATVATEGLLDWYEKVSVIAVPTPFLAVAVKTWNLPNSREMLGEGVSATLDGMPFGTTRVGLLLLHDVNRTQLKATHARAAPSPNLLMIPSDGDGDRH